MKRFIKEIPILGSILRSIYIRFLNPTIQFKDSNSYWIDWYNKGGISGYGSYGKLAEFKAETINNFVRKESIQTVIEFGCGDGNQLKYSEYPSYVGFDISPLVISNCRKIFKDDKKKEFKLMHEYNNELAELTLSLDVIFHLIEESNFQDYMNRLFNASKRFVIIYSSNTDENPEGKAEHVMHRKFSKWIESNKKEWKLISHIPNKYPYLGDVRTGSFSDFFFFQKTD